MIAHIKTLSNSTNPCINTLYIKGMDAGIFIIHNSCYCNLLFLRFSAISAVSLKKLRVLRVIRWQRFTDETTVRIEIKVNVNSKSWLYKL